MFILWVKNINLPDGIYTPIVLNEQLPTNPLSILCGYYSVLTYEELYAGTTV